MNLFNKAAYDARVDRQALADAGVMPIPPDLNATEHAVIDGMWWGYLGYEPQEGVMPLLGHAATAMAFAAAGIREERMSNGFSTSVLMIGRDGGLYWVCPSQGDVGWQGSGIRAAQAN